MEKTTSGRMTGQLLRYMLAGVIIFFVGMGQYECLHSLLPSGRWHASGVWVVHFLIGTLWTHGIHRWFTFSGAPRVPYVPSIVRTYAAYSGILVAGSGMMFLLCDLSRVHHLTGWVVTTITTSSLNFLAMRSFTIVREEKTG